MNTVFFDGITIAEDWSFLFSGFVKRDGVTHGLLCSHKPYDDFVSVDRGAVWVGGKLFSLESDAKIQYTVSDVPGAVDAIVLFADTVSGAGDIRVVRNIETDGVRPIPPSVGSVVAFVIASIVRSGNDFTVTDWRADAFSCGMAYVRDSLDQSIVGVSGGGTGALDPQAAAENLDAAKIGHTHDAADFNAGELSPAHGGVGGSPGSGVAIFSGGNSLSYALPSGPSEALLDGSYSFVPSSELFTIDAGVANGAAGWRPLSAQDDLNAFIPLGRSMWFASPSDQPSNRPPGPHPLIAIKIISVGGYAAQTAFCGTNGIESAFTRSLKGTWSAWSALSVQPVE